MALQGTYLQMLDDEEAPLNFDRQEHFKKEREERLSRAAEKKRKLLEELETKELHILHDHTYAAKPVDQDTVGKNPAPGKTFIHKSYPHWCN